MGLGLSLAFAALCASAADAPSALIMLEAMGPAAAGQVSSAAPLRFALLDDGQVFVGGTSQLLAGRLSKEEMDGIDRRVNDVRRARDLGSSVAFGPGSSGYRLTLRKGKPLELLLQGDPAAAPPPLRPLASLVADLAGFTHASMRPYQPSGYAVQAREGSLVGGCRSWTFSLPLAEALAGARAVPAAVASDWPTGATPASVCAGDKSYTVTLRPLIPGEKP